YEPEIIYKKWFFLPPSGTVTGMPSMIGDMQKDAAVRLLGNTFIRIKGTFRNYESGVHTEYQDSLFFIYDSLSADSIMENIIVLDSMQMGPVCVVLASLNKNITPDTTRVKIYDSESQARVQFVDGRVYAKGYSPLYTYNQHSSWIAAEENAIKQLREQCGYSVAVLDRYYTGSNGTSSETAVKTGHDLAIRHIKIEHRYFDTINRECVVVVSAPKNQIKKCVQY
ncbi:MAG: hypothetical protein Q4F84_00940, partial [Fibrobacter sp.]|nr:hypothetical protein [Fibrobacter sp.]